MPSKDLLIKPYIIALQSLYVRIPSFGFLIGNHDSFVYDLRNTVTGL